MTRASVSLRPSTRSLHAILRVVGWIGLGLIAVAVSLSDFLASAPADATGIGPLLAAPSAALRFGSDMLGRDMLSETLHGLSATVRAALPATLVTLVAGALFGFVAARLPRPLAEALRGIGGILASLPALLLAVLFIGLTARGWAGVAAGLSAAPFAFVRAFERAREQERATHSEYARATGISAATLLRRDLVYEFSDSILSSAARALAAVSIVLSTVSFLGFGAVPPHRDLGLMIAASKLYFLHAWWTAAFPALALTVLILFARLAAGLDEGERA
ncbi:MAG TPA: ABC transporter permease subunit [Rhizomicrobium sp.]|jgi:peptide/nickel transport system permease protein|nr:ABC transporter permease subunit [Rhizomicrobium sp.]